MLLFFTSEKIHVFINDIELYQNNVIIKVGHHGSKTSSSLSFLHQIHPMIGCISSGRNNYYGHPHKEVVEALQKENILMLNTAEKGSISIKTSSYFSIIKTAKQDISILFHFFKKD